MTWSPAMAAASAPSMASGSLRREEIARYKPAIEIELMRRIKAALDPQGIMNPGKLLPAKP